MIDELATIEKVTSSYVSQLLRVTLLAPDIVEAILDGRQPERMTLSGLMEPLPMQWERQDRRANSSSHRRLRYSVDDGAPSPHRRCHSNRQEWGVCVMYVHQTGNAASRPL